MTPLHGLRVVDLTDDSGRFATKLLAELGASVVRVHPGAGISHGPDMADPAAAARGGLLDWWYESGKRRVPLDLTTSEGAAAYRRLASGADLVIETERPGRLASLGLDHDDLRAGNPRLVQVSLTPFGRSGPRSQWVATDLVAAALGGVLSVCGTPEEAVVPWGRQSFAAASSIAALTGLAGVRHARSSGSGQLIDVSVQEAVTSSLEQVWFQYHFDDVLPYPKVAERQASLHWSRAYVVVPCRTGWCMVTATPAPKALLGWLIEEGIPGASELLAPGQEISVGDGPKLVALAAEMALRHDSGELFREAQSRHLAWAEVQTTADLVVNEQLAFRGAFVPTPDLASVRRPRFPVAFTSTPAETPTAPTPSEPPDAVDEALATWTVRNETTSAGAPLDASARPLTGVRVLDLSWVLAGPFGCRLLGDLGADVVKIQTAARATAVNDPAHGFYPVFNRSKRSLSIDMKAPGALDVVRRMVEHADVLIENYAAGVLERWGLGWDTLRSWNPRLVYVTMSGCGHAGPWSSIVSYGPTIHALSGLTALSNPPGRGDIGVGYALNDMAVGSLAAVSVVAALEARERTGEGQLVDIAQLEVGSYMIGSALMDLLSNGREAVATGNPDPYACFVFDEVVRCLDGEVAVTVRDQHDLAALEQVIGTGAEGLAQWCAPRTGVEIQDTLQAAGVPAGRVQNAPQLLHEDDQLAARHFFSNMDLPGFGERAFERFPALWSTSVLEPYLRAPAYIGEHNFEVLSEVAGMGDEEIAEALADGRLA